jgi:hypothetical protein
LQPSAPKSNQSTRNKVTVFLFGVVFSCCFCSILGIGSYWTLTNITNLNKIQKSSIENTPTPQPKSIETISPFSPTEIKQSIETEYEGEIIEDGLFLLENSTFVKLNEQLDDDQIDLTSLQRIDNRMPVFAIKGANFPLANLKLFCYYAGIGVDVTINNSQAVINTVFENSPAKSADLHPGDLITTLDGNPISYPLFYSSNKKDLLGEMKEMVSLTFLRGTALRTVELPRTYRESVGKNFISTFYTTKEISIEPKGDYVLIHLGEILNPGAYHFEFYREDPIVINGAAFGKTSVPTETPVPLPPQKWLFIVE